MTERVKTEAEMIAEMIRDKNYGVFNYEYRGPETHETEFLNLEIPIGTIFVSTSTNGEKHYWVSTGIERSSEGGYFGIHALARDETVLPDDVEITLENGKTIYFRPGTVPYWRRRQFLEKEIKIASKQYEFSMLYFIYKNILNMPERYICSKYAYLPFMYKYTMERQAINFTYPIGNLYEISIDGENRYWLSCCREAMIANSQPFFRYPRIIYGLLSHEKDSYEIQYREGINFSYENEYIRNIDMNYLRGNIVQELDMPLPEKLKFIYYCLQHEY